MTDAAPRLDQYNLVVTNMEATADFYRRLGLEIPDPAPGWGDYHRSVALPNGVSLDFDTVEFAGRWNEGWPGGARAGRGVLGFSVASREAVDALYVELTGAGHDGQQPPYDAFWGARYAVVSDPDGQAVGIMSPIDPTRKSAPPEM
jgi:catechol 2,3-dioxygenase-like lactoylglutathione lyase family enzyme